MAWLCVDGFDRELRFKDKPSKGLGTDEGLWFPRNHLKDEKVLLKGSIKKLIGRELKWQDEPIELK